MRIQEMRSGFAHLKRKSDDRLNTGPTEMQGTKPGIEPDPVLDLSEPKALSELDKYQWSVVSFDKMEAGGLNYMQAEALMGELHSCGISGLCIVTDSAAAKLN